MNDTERVAVVDMEDEFVYGPFLDRLEAMEWARRAYDDADMQEVDMGEHALSIYTYREPHY